MEDNVYAHKFFQRAARGAMKQLLRIVDGPEADNEEEDEEVMSAADKRKLKNLQRKAKKKETAAAKSSEGDKSKSSAAGGADRDGKDDDPQGQKLLSLDPVDEMGRWAAAASRCLQQQVDPSTQALVCEVSVRRRKYVLALRALKAGLKIDASHPDLIWQLVRLALLLFRGVSAEASQLALGNNKEDKRGIAASSIVARPIVMELLREEILPLLGEDGEDVAAFVLKLEARSRQLSVRHRICAARCRLLLDDSPAGRVSAGSVLLEPELLTGKGVTLEAVVEAYQVLRCIRSRV